MSSKKKISLGQSPPGVQIFFRKDRDSMKIGKVPVNFLLGTYYNIKKPDTGPDSSYLVRARRFRNVAICGIFEPSFI